MLILGIETTCDETGVGVVRDGREVLANIVASSAVMHKKFGGIVPEVAAREQVRSIIPVIKEVCQVSGVPPSPRLWRAGKYHDLDAIAVAIGPGLIGSLLIGVETAKVLSQVWRKPLIPVNHLIGHVYANWLSPVVNGKSLIVNRKSNESIDHSPLTIHFPCVALIVSGGHTDLMLMTDHGKYRWLGGTRDDAAGEVFDKVARILGLGYPGGPEVERKAREWLMVNGKSKIKFPRPMINEDHFDFSFSGLKTAVVNLVTRNQLPETSYPEFAYEFQAAVCDVLVTKTIRAAKKFSAKSIVVGGGVAANSELRSRMLGIGQGLKIDVFFPPKNLSVDNGAMIATAAYYQTNFTDPLKIQARPGLHFA